MAEDVDRELTPELSAWVLKASGGRPVRAKRLSGGGSRVTILVDAEQPGGGLLPLVLRLEGGGSHSGTSFSLEREFHVYRALEGRDVPVPKAYGLMGDGSALLLERLDGVSEFRQMAAADQPMVALRFMEVLGRLHAIEARTLDLPGFAIPGNAAEHATVDLARWEELARTSCWDEPLVRYAFARLRATAPPRVQRTVLVQGDTGPGNFMALPDRITGLIDWEFSHVGDPMDDFGWLMMRAADRLELFEAGYPLYERISGLRLEVGSVAYYAIMAILRCAVTVALGKSRGGALGVIPYRMAFHNYLVRLADLLVKDLGLAVAKDTLPEDAQKASPLFSEARGELRSFVLPDLQSHRGGIAAQAAIIALTHLELRERYSPALEALDAADRCALLGAQANGDLTSLANAAERAGDQGEQPMLTYLARRTWRNRSLWPRG